HTLAAMVHELRQLAGLGAAAADPSRPPREGDLPGDTTGPYLPPPGAGAGDSTPRPAALASSTARSTDDPAFFRTAANLGAQAAEALEHAHQLGVVHRDVKPANLMVDVRGNLWVTDFGLAQVQNEAGLTMTG